MKVLIVRALGGQLRHNAITQFRLHDLQHLLRALSGDHLEAFLVAIDLGVGHGLREYLVRLVDLALLHRFIHGQGLGRR